jgi:8-oxo-dGTP pyrophosphatase MutT (NUDIX family)
VEPRPAATVVVAREGPDGPEVLVLERSATSRFAPGFLVFPGGSVEEGDEELGRRWFGSAQDAPRACALRELFEEVGLLATAEGLVSRAPDRPIEQVEFDPPPVAAVPEISRWIAPEFLAVRFDARFFAVAAPATVHPIPDGVEIARAWWAAARDVLAAATGGEALLMWPTLRTLQALRECPTVEDVLGLHVPQEAPPIELIERLQAGDPRRRPI